MYGTSIHTYTHKRGDVVAHYDEKLEAENRELKEIIREELARRGGSLQMYDGFDEMLVTNALDFLSGSTLASVLRLFDRFLYANPVNRRERAQLAVVYETFSQLSTHADQGRLKALKERLDFFTASHR
jgi:hypothetical protein